jgi:hypothetical protein
MFFTDFIKESEIKGEYEITTLTRPYSPTKFPGPPPNYPLPYQPTRKIDDDLKKLEESYLKFMKFIKKDNSNEGYNRTGNSTSSNCSYNSNTSF